MAKKMRVGVIFGGRSGEHEVSLVSADSVIKNLNQQKYEIIPIGITKQGRWLTQGEPIQTLKEGSFNNIETSSLITPDTTKQGLVKISSSANINKIKKIDVIIPVLHGTYGEDGSIQGLLELANIPYVGANVLASALGMDKISQKYIFRQNGLPIVNFINFNASDYKKEKDKIIKKACELKFPMFIKPSNMGSSIGISRAINKHQLLKSINNALQYDQRILIEEGVLSPREIEVAILGNDNPRASVCGEVISSNNFYDYNAKYVDGQSKVEIPANLPQKISEKIKKLAISAFQLISCTGMARVDFLINKSGKIYLSEINTIPGFTSISMYPRLWAASKLSYTKLLDLLIELALERHQQKSKLSTSFESERNWYKK